MEDIDNLNIGLDRFHKHDKDGLWIVFSKWNG